MLVKVNGGMSPSFEMFNSTRQGCPLSPLLYVLSLEPLLATIRNNTDVGGVKMGEEENKVMAYAGDIWFYISNPRTTLPNIIKELKIYGELSNLKINPIKLNILDINVSNNCGISITDGIHILWVEIKIPWNKINNFVGENVSS